MEKHLLASSRYWSQNSKNIPFSDVARTCIIVYSLEDIQRTITWFKEEQSLALLRCRNRFGPKPSNPQERRPGTGQTWLFWQDVILNVVFVDKPDVVFEVQLVHHLMANCDLRNTEEFEEVRFCREILAMDKALPQ